jgi:hypothetical protein
MESNLVNRASRDRVWVIYNHIQPDLQCKPYPLLTYKRRGRGGLNPSNHNTPTHTGHRVFIRKETQTCLNPMSLTFHSSSYPWAPLLSIPVVNPWQEQVGRAPSDGGGLHSFVVGFDLGIWFNLNWVLEKLNSLSRKSTGFWENRSINYFSFPNFKN